MASANHVVVMLTEGALGSPFVFHEILFADWLGKKLVTAMFKNVWKDLRASMKAVLGKLLEGHNHRNFNYYQIGVYKVALTHPIRSYYYNETKENMRKYEKSEKEAR